MSRTSRSAAAIATAIVFLAPLTALAGPEGGAVRGGPDLIPRDVLFGNPDRASVQISPDGQKIAFLAPVSGVMNVWVGPVARPDDAKPVTSDTVRGIRQYFWAYTGAHVLYLQDKGGDENWHIYSADLAGNKQLDLTPFETVPGPDGQPMKMPNGKVIRPAAQVEGVTDTTPTEILVGLNNRHPQFHDLYRVDITTGKLTLVQENPGYAGYVTDDNYKARYAVRFTRDGGIEILQPGADAKSEWAVCETIPMEDTQTTNIIGFDRAGEILYRLDSRGRNTAALTATDVKTGKSTTIAEDKDADVSGTIVDPKTHRVQAVSTNYRRTSWKILDNAIKADFAYLASVADGDINITSRTQDDKRWIVAYVLDNGPVRYYLYDRVPGSNTAGKANFLFTNRKSLENLTLAKMTPVVPKSRDGLPLVCYLTLPVGAAKSADTQTPAQPLPLVLNVHGGPWARDTWGFNSTHQWLANRGYAVLSVNYRGSTGFGKNFINAANGEWAAKMHDDLLDAVKWAVDNKIADPQRVAIMGGSYGGYATLVGLTFTPDEFACGVDIVGPSSLNTLVDNVPPYWVPILPMLTSRLGGDPKTEAGRKFLEERSPLSRVDKIKKPLLIGQGANDPRVNQVESDQIVAAMKTKNIPVTYVLFPDEGHGFARPENRLSFYAVSEAFLAEHLGGKYEPIGDDFKNSSIQVPEGSQHVPGLADSLHK